MPVRSLAPRAERWQQVFTLQMPWLQFFLQKKDKKKHAYIYVNISVADRRGLRGLL